MSERNQFSHKETNDKIWTRDKGLCVYCGQPANVIDHIIPVTHFGHATYNNGVLACDSCNAFRRWHPEDIRYLEKAYNHLLKHGVNIDIINPTISDFKKKKYKRV